MPVSKFICWFEGLASMPAGDDADTRLVCNLTFACYPSRFLFIIATDTYLTCLPTKLDD